MGVDGWAGPLAGGGFEGEEIGGARVEGNKQVVSLIGGLGHFPPLGGQVSTGVQRAQTFIGNLEVDRNRISSHTFLKPFWHSCIKWGWEQNSRP